jgi:hypothetical protein
MRVHSRPSRYMLCSSKRMEPLEPQEGDGQQLGGRPGFYHEPDRVRRHGSTSETRANVEAEVTGRGNSRKQGCVMRRRHVFVRQSDQSDYGAAALATTSVPESYPATPPGVEIPADNPSDGNVRAGSVGLEAPLQ